MRTCPFRDAAVALALFAGASATSADPAADQTAVSGSGPAPVATRFVAGAGAVPVMFDVGARARGRREHL